MLQSSFLDSCNLDLLCLLEHEKCFDKDLGLALFLWWLIAMCSFNRLLCLECFADEVFEPLPGLAL